MTQQGYRDLADTLNSAYPPPAPSNEGFDWYTAGFNRCVNALCRSLSRDNSRFDKGLFLQSITKYREP